MLSLILQLQHTDEGFTFRGVWKGDILIPCAWSKCRFFFCCHPKKYLLDWATSYLCYLMPKYNVNNMYAVCHSYPEILWELFPTSPLIRNGKDLKNFWCSHKLFVPNTFFTLQYFSPYFGRQLYVIFNTLNFFFRHCSATSLSLRNSSTVIRFRSSDLMYTLLSLFIDGLANCPFLVHTISLSPCIRTLIQKLWFWFS